MREWFDKIIDKLLGWPTATEGLEYDTDFTRKIRDLQRRIEEQKQQIGYYTTQPGISREHGEAEEPIQDMGQIQKNAELNDLKAKLLGKKK